MRLKERELRILQAIKEHGWLMCRAVVAITKDRRARIVLHELFQAGFLEREQAPGYRHYQYRVKKYRYPVDLSAAMTNHSSTTSL